MPQSLTLPAAGLMTDPGPFTAAPDGGLAGAQNVVLLRPGVIEPRPGMHWLPDATTKAASAAAHAIYLDDSDSAWIWAVTAGGTWSIRRDLSTSITGPDTFTRGKIRIAPTGGRALFTSDNGVCTLPLQNASPKFGSSTIAYRAGMPQPFAPQFVTATAPTGYPAAAAWLPNGDSVAYRVTLRRILANGTIVESAPSCRCVVTNSAGAARGIALWGVVPIEVYYAWAPDGVGAGTFNSLMAGDELCIYRSARITGTPSDEMRLRAVLTYDTTYNGFTTIVNGIATPWFDGLDDSMWTGAALYTNSTQEGSAYANFRPEYARDIALYNQMTFYGGVRTPQRLDLTLKISGTAATVNDPQNAMCTFAFTGDTTIATNTIVNCTNIRYFSVGQQIGSAADPNAVTQFPAGTTVTAISVATNTVTVSANATATAAGAAFVAWDWIESSDANTRTFHYNGAGGGGTPATARYWAQTAESLDARWNGTFDTTIQLRCTGATPLTEIVCSWFRPDCTDAAFTIRTTKPLAWSRYCDNATGITSEQLGSIAELQWSKVSQPESVPIPNRTTVGDAAYAIRRICVARNSLLVFKDDGLYQAFGQTPDTLTFELVDRTITLPTPATYDEQSKWLDRFDDRVIAMTTRGPMLIGDADAQPIGAPILESLREQFALTFGARDDAQRALVIDFPTRRGWFVWNVDGAARAYVVDLQTDTWTYWTWRREIGAACIRPAPGSFPPPSSLAVAGQYWAGVQLDDRSMLNDGTYTIATLPTTYETWSAPPATITDVDATGSPNIWFVTLDVSATEWIPAVGDIAKGSVSTDSWAIRANYGGGLYEFEGPGVPFVGQFVNYYESYPVRVTWLARAERNVGAEKHWLSVAYPFEQTGYFGYASGYVAGYRNPTPPNAVQFFASQPQHSPWTLAPVFARIGVSRECARDWALKVGFSIQQAGMWFSTAGLSVLYEEVASDKVSRGATP